jgi:hypothetical protein
LSGDPLGRQDATTLMATRRNGKRRRRDVEESLLSAGIAFVVLVFGYGVIRYPNAPIRLHEDGTYRDKVGQKFTEAEFHGFKTWERCLYGSFAIFAASGIPMAVSKRRRARRDR